MEILLELLLEVFLQLILEILGAVFDGVFGHSSRMGKAASKFIYYLLLGAALGWLSYLIWPHPFLVKAPSLLISLLLVPLLAASATVFLSRFFEKKWDWDIETTRFGYSFYFALVFAGVRHMLLF